MGPKKRTQDGRISRSNTCKEGNMHKELEQKLDIFSEEWMNECYRRVAYPNQKCLQVLEEFRGALGKRVSKPRDSELKQQAVFYLLGPEFTEQYFPQSKYNIEVFDSSKMSANQRSKYMEDARKFLQKSVQLAIQDMNYPTGVGNISTSEKEGTLGPYIEEIRNTFGDGLQKQTAIELFQDKASRDRAAEGNEGMNFLEKKPSDIAVKALLALFIRDDNQISYSSYRIQEKRLSLPITLRDLIWTDQLLKKANEELKYNKGDVMAYTMTRFKRLLDEQMKLQKVTRAIHSKNWKLINMELIEWFDNSQPLEKMNANKRLIQGARTLNLVDVARENFTTSFIFWLVPLHLICQRKEEEDKESFTLRLATLLDLIINHWKISPNVAFDVASDAVEFLKEQDREYGDHLYQMLKGKASEIQYKDYFYPEIYSRDSSKCQQISSALQKRPNDPETLHVFTDPEIFVRKWIIQGFVGVLSLNASLWAWDQLVFSSWSQETIKNIVLSILSLIRPWAMKASSYNSIRQVLIDEPGMLYTSDLRSALRHIEGRHDFQTIPSSNNYVVHGAEPEEEEQEEIPIEQPWRPRAETPRKPRVRRLPSMSILPANAATPLDLNLELNFDDDDNQPLNKPQRPVPHTRTLPKVPEMEEPWVQRVPHLRHKPVTNKEPFDFYIDCIRYLPDNIIFVKVSYRLIHTTEKFDIDPQVYTELNSLQKRPNIRFKTEINGSGATQPDNSLILLAVYGYERTSRDVVSLGYCMVPLYDLKEDSPELRLGGHQLRLRHGKPNLRDGLKGLKSSDLDINIAIPGLTLCYRLLPSNAEKKFIKAPEYESGYYDSSSCETNDCEALLYEHYLSDANLGKLTVKNAIKSIEKSLTSEEDLKFKNFVTEKLDHKTKMAAKMAIPSQDFSKFKKYNIKHGLRVLMMEISGLPILWEGKHIQAYCEVIPGKRAAEAKSGTAKDENFITQKYDPSSSVRAPEWLDPPFRLYPVADSQSILLIQLFGIVPKYSPENDSSIVTSTGKEISVDYRKPYAWSVLPLFTGEYVNAGCHNLALFKRGISPEILKALQEASSVAETLRRIVDENYTSAEVVEKCALVLYVTDGILKTTHLPEVLQDQQIQKLKIKPRLGDPSDKKLFEKFVSTEILNNETYSAVEWEKFQKAANSSLFTALNKSLKELKKKPLPVSY